MHEGMAAQQFPVPGCPVHVLRLDLDEGANAEMDGGVVGESYRDAAPVGLVGDGDLRDRLPTSSGYSWMIWGTTIGSVSAFDEVAPA